MQTVTLSRSDLHRAAYLKWRNVPPGMPAELADEFMRRLIEGSSLRRLTSGDKRCGPALVTPQRFKKHCELHPEWGARAMELMEINRKLADKKKGRPNLDLALRAENARVAKADQSIPTFPELKARNFSVPACAATATCTNCPHPSDCAVIGECLDTINARAIVPHQEEYMRPAQATACMSALEGGMSKRLVTGYVKGTQAIVSANKFAKHCAKYPIWGTWALALVERNYKLADKKKGHVRDPDFCIRGHAFAIHARSYLQRDGRVHRQCMACTSLRHMNPTHTPKPELVARVIAAIDGGQRVGSFTKKFKKPDAFICDFRQLRAIRRLHPELERKISANAERPIIRPALPFIIRSNVRTPTLTGIIAAPADPLFTLADQTIPRTVPTHIRRDAVVMLATALWLGEVKPEDVRQASAMFVRAAWKEDRVDRRFVSLDAPAFRDGDTPLIERIGESQRLWA